MQIKDKVLDGVGKHFVGHGCFVLLILLVVEGKGRRETYRDRRLEGARRSASKLLYNALPFHRVYKMQTLR